MSVTLVETLRTLFAKNCAKNGKLNIAFFPPLSRFRVTRFRRIRSGQCNRFKYLINFSERLIRLAFLGSVLSAVQFVNDTVDVCKIRNGFMMQDKDKDYDE